MRGVRLRRGSVNQNPYPTETFDSVGSSSFDRLSPRHASNPQRVERHHRRKIGTPAAIQDLPTGNDPEVATENIPTCQPDSVPIVEPGNFQSKWVCASLLDSNESALDPPRTIQNDAVPFATAAVVVTTSHGTECLNPKQQPDVASQHPHTETTIQQNRWSRSRLERIPNTTVFAESHPKMPVRHRRNGGLVMQQRRRMHHIVCVHVLSLNTSVTIRVVSNRRRPRCTPTTACATRGTSGWQRGRWTGCWWRRWRSHRCTCEDDRWAEFVRSRKNPRMNFRTDRLRLRVGLHPDGIPLRRGKRQQPIAR